LNLKLLLGIKASQNKSTGTIIYKKKKEGNGYYLQYATIERGQYFYINRPLKFIELTREDKDVLSLDIKVEGNSSSKTEFLNLSRSPIAASEITKIKEDDFKYITIKSYDPKIWKDYNAIEPLEEMKRFKAAN
ncbi:MAG: carboxypeptidase-like regulatory domain-containing protein, partial [Flavobacterium sp.]|nr:carboxypeptidase-like regulatory domain-containing protein [Flavobacterium sp.]